MKIKDIDKHVKSLDQMTCARDILKEIEKVLFLLEQVEPESLEEQRIKDILVLDISMNLPIIKAKVEIIEMYGEG